jgi:hypothetical protein
MLFSIGFPIVVFTIMYLMIIFIGYAFEKTKKRPIQSLLYKPRNEQTLSVEIKVLSEKAIEIEFYSDHGKFGTIEPLAGYILTPERLFQILKERNDYSDDEL